MGPSRQVLVVDAYYKAGGNRGIWAISFDGGRKNMASAKGLQGKWAKSILLSPGRKPGSGSTYVALGSDRLAMVTRPEVRVMAPGPRQLLVFWNSAKPIRAWASKGMADEPKNATWSRNGGLLAFTAGNMLHVWQPTEKPGEPGLPGGERPEVF